MSSPEPTSPPSRRHRPKPRLRPSAKRASPPPPPPRLDLDSADAPRVAEREATQAVEVSGHALAAPNEEALGKAAQVEGIDERGDSRRIDGGVTATPSSPDDSPLTPLARLGDPRPSLEPNPRVDAGLPLSQLFADERFYTPIRPLPPLSELRTRASSPARVLDPISDKRSNRRTPRTVSRAKSNKRVEDDGIEDTRRRELWSQIDDFERPPDDKGEGDEEAAGSIERFGAIVLPIATAIEKRRQEEKRRRKPQNERSDGLSMNEGDTNGEDSGDDSAPPQPRRSKPERQGLKRVSTFLGAAELARLDKGGRNLLVEAAPYRTRSKDVGPLSLVRPSLAGLGGSFDPCPDADRPKEKKNPADTKVRRLAPGQTPRTPFLRRVSQTAFATLVDVGPPQKVLPRTRPALPAPPAPSARWSRPQQRRPKRKVGTSEGRERGKEELEFVAAEAAGYVFDSHDRVPRLRMKRRKVARRIPPVHTKPAEPRFRYVPVRLPRPVRPFAALAPPPPPIPTETTHDSIQSRTAPPTDSLDPRSIGPASPAPVPPEDGHLRSKRGKPSFRFVVGPKARRLPTMMLAHDTPTERPEPSLSVPPTRLKRHLTISSPPFAHLGASAVHQPSEKAGKAPVAHGTTPANADDEEGQPSRKKPRLLRRLPTVPDYQPGELGLRVQATAPSPDLFASPEPLNAYAPSSHSNSRKSTSPFTRSALRLAPAVLPFSIPVSPLPSSDRAPPASQARTPTSIRPSQPDSDGSFDVPSSFERDALEALRHAEDEGFSAGLDDPLNYLDEPEPSDGLKSDAREWWQDSREPTASAFPMSGVARHFPTGFALRPRAGRAARRFEPSSSFGAVGEQDGEAFHPASAELDGDEDETEVVQTSPPGHAEEDDRPPSSIWAGLGSFGAEVGSCAGDTG